MQGDKHSKAGQLTETMNTYSLRHQTLYCCVYTK